MNISYEIRNYESDRLDVIWQKASPLFIEKWENMNCDGYFLDIELNVAHLVANLHSCVNFREEIKIIFVSLGIASVW
jgi:hypothetical protein